MSYRLRSSTSLSYIFHTCCFSILQIFRIVRARVRDDDGRGDDPGAAAGHPHGRGWRGFEALLQVHSLTFLFYLLLPLQLHLRKYAVWPQKITFRENIFGTRCCKTTTWVGLSFGIRIGIWPKYFCFWSCWWTKQFKALFGIWHVFQPTLAFI